MGETRRETEAAIAANVELPPEKYPQHSTTDLFREVLQKLVMDTDFPVDRIDGVFSIGAGKRRGNEMTHQWVIDELNIESLLGATMYAGGATFTVMLDHARLAIAHGEVDAVLCIGASKFGLSDADDSERRGVGHPEFEAPYGLTVPAAYGLIARRYMFEHGADKVDLSRVAVCNREWACRCRTAYMGDEGHLSVESVLESRRICDPFHLLHCSVPVAGGGAVVVTSGELARETVDTPVYISGLGQARGTSYVSQRPELRTDAPVRSSKAAYQEGNVTPQDIDVAQLYDAFAFNPLEYVETMGFVREGEGPHFFEEGLAAPCGTLPINTNGGLLSYGHIGAASGITMLNEAINQVAATAGSHQVPDVQHALVHTHGGIMADHGTIILGANPP